jgi:hypothetical protein
MFPATPNQGTDTHSAKASARHRTVRSLGPRGVNSGQPDHPVEDATKWGTGEPVATCGWKTFVRGRNSTRTCEAASFALAREDSSRRGSLHFATCRRGRIHLATFCRGSLHFAASRRGWKSSFAGPRARPDPATPCGAWPEMARTRGCFVRPGIPSRLDAACRGSLHLVRGKHNQPLFLTFPPRPGVFVGATLPLHHRAKPRSRTRHSASANDFRPRPNACAGTSPQGVALHQTSAP